MMSHLHLEEQSFTWSFIWRRALLLGQSEEQNVQSHGRPLKLLPGVRAVAPV